MPNLRSQVVQIGAMLIIGMVPLFFDPWATTNLEAQKVGLFQTLVLAMVIGWFCASVLPEKGGRQTGQSPFGTSKLSVAALMNDSSLFPLWLYAGAYLLATSQSANLQASLWGRGNGHGMLTTLCVIAMAYLCAREIRSWRQLESLVSIMLAVSLPLCLYGIVQFFGADPLNWRNGVTASPVSSTLGLSIFFAAYLVLVIPFTLSRIGASGDRSLHAWIFYSVLLCIQLVTLLFTLARGAILGLAAGLVVYVLLVSHSWKRSMRVTAVIIVVTAAAILYFVVATYGTVLIPSGTQPASLPELAAIRRGSDGLRLWMWSAAMSLLQSAPILGYGPETFISTLAAANNAQFDTARIEATKNDVHSIFLNHMWSAGLFGLTAFVWILVNFFRRMHKVLKDPHDQYRALGTAAVVAVTAYLVQAQFQSDMIASYALFWFLVTINRA